MRRSGLPTRRRSRTRRGVTLVEAVISVVIVGVMFAAAVSTVVATKLAERVMTNRRQGQLLAQALMAEIVIQDYEEPVGDPPIFGRESGESGGARDFWDDVDDYAGWSSSPPESKGGIPMDGLADWRRSVDVVWVNPTNLNQVGANTGVKRITVTASHNDVPVAELVAIRTAGWPR